MLCMGTAETFICMCCAGSTVGSGFRSPSWGLLAGLHVLQE